MDSYRFNPDMTFAEARRMMQEIDSTDHRGQVAKLTWLEGNAKDQSIPFLYDEMADRFGHSVDKSAMHSEVMSCLYNGIPVEVRLIPRPGRGGGN